MPLPSTTTLPGANTLPGTSTFTFPVNPNWAAVSVQVQFVIGTWTALPNRVKAVSLKRGRQYELDAPQAGTLNVTFDNYDGALDPMNTASVYYPNVKLMRPIRVQATYGGTTYTLFTGFVERWPQRWNESGNGQWTDIVATDVFGSLSRQKLEHVFYEQMKITNPVSWYPLDDMTGATLLKARVSGQRPATVLKGVRDLGNNVVVGGNTATALGTPGVPQLRLNTPAVGDVGSCIVLPDGQLPPYPWTMFFTYVQPAASSGSTDTSVGVWMNSADLSQTLEVDVGYFARLIVQPSGSASTVTSGSQLYQSANDGKPHTVAISQAADGATFRMYIDGLSSGTITIPTASVFNMQFVSIGGIGDPTGHYNNSAVNAVAGATISNFAVFSGDLLSSGQTAMTNLASAYLKAGYGQTPEARLATTKTFLPPLANTTTTITAAGSGAMQNTVLNGKNGFQAISEPAVADGGVVYVAGNGNLVFAGRTYRFAPKPTLTFGELNTELHYKSVVSDYDLTRVFNEVTVTQPAPGNEVATVKSTTSRDSYGTRSLAVTLDVVSAQQVVDASTFLLAFYAEPGVRIPSLELHPAENPNLWAAALGTDLNTAITIKRRPQAGVGFSHICWVENISMTIDMGNTFTVVWELSPGDQNTYFTLDNSVYGVLDAGNRIAY